ncbi:DUF2316 family protein [Streptomyces sp. NPDC096068]|uniref:DUF2316 family protein n=1 Tax=Streptomyces sp. NPDC096068 TaxID=3155424 RepID=UPI00331885BD
MSLNEEERKRTREELRANLRLSGADPEEIAAELGFTARRLDDTLDVTEASGPQDVWLLRDHLDDLVTARGGTPVPYTVLTERARLAASAWFPLRRAPRRGRGN